MNKIASFTVDHNKLNRGIYVSRKDEIEDIVITTFDIRMKLPNREPVMNTAEIHAVEHLGATFLRNHAHWKDSIIYFGPMGCRTGFYLIVSKNVNSNDVLPLVKEMFEFIIEFNDIIPGASESECGNYLDMNLNMAKHESIKFLHVLNNITDDQLKYPE